MTRSLRITIGVLVGLVVLGTLGYGGYRHYRVLDQNVSLLKEKARVENELSRSESTLADTESSLTSSENALVGTKKTLADTEFERDMLAEELRLEIEKYNTLQGQIDDISSAVGVLEKLSETDEELLQKYSKVFFLNEHYAPPKIAEIESKYVFKQDKDQYIHSDVLTFLEKLLFEAREEGIELEIVSAYRSFGEQSSLKAGYTFTYGAGTANKFSADQGYSEHQLGTTVDFTTTKLGAAFTEFAATAAYTWLEDNAHKYGFVLSYPEDNSYYRFEPWHWRFVGKLLARRLYVGSANFYELDQREINEYLVTFFD